MTLRAAGYIRVSTSAQVEGYSLPAQERAILAACELRNYELVTIYREEGASAFTDRIDTRPQFSALIESVKRHEVDVVVVHSVDRISRSLLVLLTFYKYLADAHAAFVALSDNLDYTTPEGKLQLQIQGAVSEWFSVNQGRHITKGKHERARAGKQNNRPPTGYMTTPAGVVFDPETVEMARTMWRSAAAGLTMRNIQRQVAQHGRVFPRDSLRMMLHNRFYTGKVQWRGQWHPGQHPALIDDATFDTVQAFISSNQRIGSAPDGGPRARKYTYPLSGILTCSACGAHYVGHHRGFNYVCNKHAEQVCPEPGVSVLKAGVQFAAILRRVAVPDDELRTALADRPQPAPVDIAALDRRLLRLRDLYELGDIERDAYMHRRDDLQREKDAALRTVTADDMAVSLEHLRGIADTWATMDRADQRDVARSLVQDMLLSNRQIVSLKPHPAWYDLFAAILPPDPAHTGYLRLT